MDPIKSDIGVDLKDILYLMEMILALVGWKTMIEPNDFLFYQTFYRSRKNGRHFRTMKTSRFAFVYLHYLPLTVVYLHYLPLTGKVGNKNTNDGASWFLLYLSISATTNKQQHAFSQSRSLTIDFSSAPF